LVIDYKITNYHYNSTAEDPQKVGYYTPPFEDFEKEVSGLVHRIGTNLLHHQVAVFIKP